MILIGTHTQVTNYIAKVDSERNWGSGTKMWAKPKKHPNQETYACLVHPEVHPDSGSTVNELDETWQTSEP